MNKRIKVKTPAKINLSLEIIDKFSNGFHSLSTIMQTVSLYDYLTINISEKIGDNEIVLHGNSTEIPYDEKNIVYKVLKLYLDCIDLKGLKVDVNIEKHIPAQAGLAGGSTNGAGALVGINSILNNLLSIKNLHEIAAKVGSDLNFCLEGGACLLSSRGEIIDEKLPYQKFNVAIIKPKNIAVSTPECYKNFSENFFEKKNPYYSSKIVNIYKNNFNIKNLSQFLYNDLEKPAISMHKELQNIKEELMNSGCYNSLMSGSGSSVFGIYENKINISQNDNYEIYYAISTANGVEVI